MVERDLPKVETRVRFPFPAPKVKMKPKSIKILIRETNVNYYAWAMIADGFLLLPDIKRYLGKSVTVGLQEIKEESGQYGFDIKNWFDLGRICLNKMEQGKFSIEKLSKEHLFAANTIMDLCSQVQNKDLSKVSVQQMKRWLKALWQPYLKINGLGFIPVISDFEHNYLTNKLVSILRNHGTHQDQVQLLLSELITPTKINRFWKEKKDLLELVVRHKNLRALRQSADFKQHIRKYTWLNYGYQGPLWTEHDFVESAERILKNKVSVSRQLKEHSEYFKDLLKQQKLSLRKLGLNNKEKYFFDIAKEFVYLKGLRVEVRHNFGYTSDLIFAELSKRFKLHPKFFRFCTREEIVRQLEGKNINKKAILKRIKHTIETLENKKRKFYSPKEGKKLFAKVIQKEEFSEGVELKGQTAFPGLVRGKVKIVHSVKDLDKVQHGDIMVAITTNPDFMPAMYRALAFVTDVGGITSHAAIVAREMKKPCIIGTKFATKLLKDNDTVEVDANKGFVNIVN